MAASPQMRATWFGQYKAMLLKNFLLKRRNLKYTIYEFVLPLYMVAILAIIRATSVQDAKPPLPMFPEYLTSDPMWGPATNTSLRVLVNPNTDFTKSILNDVVSMSQINLVPEYYGNDSAMQSAYDSNGTAVFAGITFSNDFSYAIRMNDDKTPNTDPDEKYQDQSKCRNDKSGVSCTVTQYLRSGFSKFQTLIDTAIIRNKTGNSGFPVGNSSVQMLPKPAYLQDTEFLQTLSSIYFVLAFTPLINVMTVLIVTEKEKKIKEGMKMMGLRSSVFWFSWSTVYFVIITAVSLCVTIIALAAQFFQHSNMFLFFIMIWLYGMSIMSISFLMTPFFNKAQTAGGLATFATMLASLLYLIVSQTREYEEGTGSASYTVPVYGRWLLCLLSPTALSLGIDQAVYLDVRGGMTFSSASEGEFPLYGPILMLLIDTVFYFLLAMYLDMVLPGEYGPRQKPLFLCTKEFWFPKKSSDTRISFSNRIYDDDDTVGSAEEVPNPDIEPVPQSMKSKAAVRIKKLSKIFTKKGEDDVKAVNELSLTMYEDQITAILGHNGAGKTTLINILTGMTGPSSGSASMFGLDVSDTNDMDVLREMTGICPQHNILFDPLTCAEHLRLFAALKGVPVERMEKEVQTALDSVDLKDKADEMSQTLSGGQKRKLSVAIAIIGDPKIIILDEPTAGMDPYSRRHLWSILKEKKKGRIILLTTHFMDEADILADRKAIVNKGALRSCGSSLFLKNRFGLGYHLNMVVEPSCDTGRVCQMVSGFVPGSEINRIHGKELDITMPHDGVTKFAGLFQQLEQDSILREYGLKSYGVSMTTLEEVFLKLEEDLENIELEEKEDKASPYKTDKAKSPQYTLQSAINVDTPNQINPSSSVKCLEGMDLSMQRFRALCFIRLLQTLRKGVTLFWKFAIPVGLLIGGLIVSKNVTQSDVKKNAAQSQPLVLDPVYYASLVSGVGGNFPYGTIPKFLMHDTVGNVDTGAFVSNISSVYQTSTYQNSYTNDSLLLLDKAVAPHYLGMQIDKFDATNSKVTDLKYKIWFNDSAIHSIPACLNLINNFLLKAEEAAAGITGSNNSLSVTNHPWPNLNKEPPKWNNAAFLAVLLIGMAFSYIPGAFGPNVVEDRETKARSQLRVSGVSFAMYWSTYFAVDFVVFLIPAVLMVICIFAIGVDTFVPPGAAGSVVLLCFCYLPSNILFAYFFSFMFDKTETAEGVMPSLYGVLGYLPYLPVSMVDMLANAQAAEIMHTIFCLLIPPYNLFGGLYYINKIYTIHLFTNTLDDIETSEYFDVKSNIPTAYICSLLHIVIFFFLLRLLDISKTGGDIRETCFLARNSNSVEPETPVSTANRYEDEDVTAERTRVKGLQSGTIGKEFPVAIAEDLRKEFKKAGQKKGGGCDCKSQPKEEKVKVAVHDTTFAVEAGEVFGLLGPNGAGKTTTLNMMTADVGPDSGRVIVGGYDINSAMSDAFQAMGYCPQHDALWKTVTLKEHLDCYAKVRGIPPENHFEVTNYFMENLKLEEHKNKHAKKLSGGTKRKMSYGMSMLGRPKIVLLDEPSTGMDPQSKRFLWDTISNSFQSSERGAILTTHYMEEADALCSRIAIMVNGKIECIGSSQHLKSKYGSGYLLEVKIRQEEDTAMLNQKMERLKGFVLELFPNATVMEQFSERVQYKVPKTNVTSLAKVFSTLEEGKASFDIAEYSFSQSTLEQVFLEFAKMQMEEGEAHESEEITTKKSILRSMSQNSESAAGPERL